MLSWPRYTTGAKPGRWQPRAVFVAVPRRGKERTLGGGGAEGGMILQGKEAQEGWGDVLIIRWCKWWS